MGESSGSDLHLFNRIGEGVLSIFISCRSARREYDWSSGRPCALFFPPWRRFRLLQWFMLFSRRIKIRLSRAAPSSECVPENLRNWHGAVFYTPASPVFAVGSIWRSSRRRRNRLHLPHCTIRGSRIVIRPDCNHLFKK